MQKKFNLIKRSDGNYTLLGILSVLLLLTATYAFSFFGDEGLLGKLKNSGFLSEIYPAIVANITNSHRNDEKLSTLSYNLELEKAAKNKAEDMIKRGYFAHFSPDGKKPWDWIKEAGYSYIYAGENLAINYSESKEVVDAWINSPSHKANIMNVHFDEIGVAVATTTVAGQSSYIVVEMFGSRADYSADIKAKSPVGSRAGGRQIAVLDRPVSTILPVGSLLNSTSTATSTAAVVATSTATSSLKGVLGANTYIGGVKESMYYLVDNPIKNVAQPYVIILAALVLILIFMALIEFIKGNRREGWSALGAGIILILACFLYYYFMV